jgi:hypothetical protein
MVETYESIFSCSSIFCYQFQGFLLDSHSFIAA